MPHSMEIGRAGLGGDGKGWRVGDTVYGDRDNLPRDLITQKLTTPNAERVFYLRHALRAGLTVDEIFELSKIDRWFLTQIRNRRLRRGTRLRRRIRLTSASLGPDDPDLPLRTPARSCRRRSGNGRHQFPSVDRGQVV